MILRRLPDSRFSEVLPAWTGATCVLLGGGPSMTQAQVALVQRAREADSVRVMAINNSFLWAPFADILHAADARWWDWHKYRSELRDFAGERCSIQNSSADVPEPVHVLRNRDHPNHGSGLSLDPQAVATGRNSAWQALNVAILAGAKKIILLGIDGRPGADGKTHWHSGHPTPTPAAAYEEYRRAWSAGEAGIKAAGVRVINASPDTFIDTFEKMELKDALT